MLAKDGARGQPLGDLPDRARVTLGPAALARVMATILKKSATLNSSSAIALLSCDGQRFNLPRSH
jgi:hypothetical protein